MLTKRSTDSPSPSGHLLGMLLVGVGTNHAIAFHAFKDMTNRTMAGIAAYAFVVVTGLALSLSSRGGHARQNAERRRVTKSTVLAFLLVTLNLLLLAFPPANPTIKTWKLHLLTASGLVVAIEALAGRVVVVLPRPVVKALVLICAAELVVALSYLDHTSKPNLRVIPSSKFLIASAPCPCGPALSDVVQL